MSKKSDASILVPRLITDHEAFQIRILVITTANCTASTREAQVFSTCPNGWLLGLGLSQSVFCADQGVRLGSFLDS